MLCEVDYIQVYIPRQDRIMIDTGSEFFIYMYIVYF